MANTFKNNLGVEVPDAPIDPIKDGIVVDVMDEGKKPEANNEDKE